MTATGYILKEKDMVKGGISEAGGGKLVKSFREKSARI